MKKLSWLFSTLLLVAFFSSCMVQIPIKEEAPKNNNTYNVSYLFEHDGCKVYRFLDNGNYVYFTNCKGNVTSVAKDSTKAQVQTIVNTQ